MYKKEANRLLAQMIWREAKVVRTLTAKELGAFAVEYSDVLETDNGEFVEYRGLFDHHYRRP